MNQSTRDHWNQVYASKDITTLGWYEETPKASIQLFSRCALAKDAPILEVGAGATKFIDYLLDEQYSNVTAVDISDIALNKLQQRLGVERSSRINWVVDDLTEPQVLTQLEPVALWHDRAVVHFLLDADQRASYFSTLKQLVKPNGYVIIAVFSLDGAKQCSGLDVRNYDSHMIALELGDEFTLLETFDYIYYNPSGGARPYVYTLFQRSVG